MHEAPMQPEPVRIFVGATAAERLPARVLEFSIRETSSLGTDIRSLYTCGRSIPMPKARENRPRTPFSFQRFLIPELCAYRGKAIYLDADMLVFRDIAALWRQDMRGYALQSTGTANSGRRAQFSVLLLNCAALDWNIDRIVAALDAGRLNYAALMGEMRVAGAIGRDIPAVWNSLERYQSGQTALLHYTDMHTQPWVSTANPLGHLWMDCLRRAMQAGFITSDDLSREISAGHVRPSLRAQIDASRDDRPSLPAALLKTSMRKADRAFRAPYRSLDWGRWHTIGARLQAGLQRFMGRS